MIISHKYKFIFFCNGKTGTKSIESALAEYDETNWENLGFKSEKEYVPFYQARHIPPMALKEKISRGIWDNYFKFVFVRNPWDWVISSYHYNNNRGRLSRFLKPRKFKEKHFRKHEEQTEKWRGVKEAGARFQYTWAYDFEGNKLVDFVGKFERLQEDFNKICDRIGIRQIKLERINKTKHRPYQDIYTDRTKRLVAEKYKKDIELFNYSFNS